MIHTVKSGNARDRIFADETALAGTTGIFPMLSSHGNMPANLENSAVAERMEKSVFFPIPRKRNAKQCLNYHTVDITSHTSKVMLKILQDRLQQYVNRELPDVQDGFRKGRGTRDQIANIRWIIKKQESSRKTFISALLTMPKPLTV